MMISAPRSVHRFTTLSRGFRQCLAVSVAVAFLLTPQTVEAVQSKSFLVARMNVSAPSAAQQICKSYDWACSKSGASHSLSQADMDLIRKVNRRINRDIRQVSDKTQYQKLDYWTLPSNRRGDCEDIALLKKKTLVGHGIAPERLLLATVLDRNRQGHAVLVLRTDSGDYILDSLTNEIKSWRSTRYTFLRMQNPDAPRRWVGLMVRG